jgi:hypothetical protein
MEEGRKSVEKCEEADKNKGMASSSKCKVYETFNVTIVAV